MGSIPDPGDEFDEISPAPSFEEFQRQASLMTSCTLLWKELSDHFSSLEQNLQKKSESLMFKIKTLDSQTKQSLQFLDRRDVTIDSSLSLALSKLHDISSAALSAVSDGPDGGEVDDAEGLKSNLRFYCMKMDSEGLWRFVTLRKKELESIRAQMGLALADCVDPAMFVLEAISTVFPVDKREEKSERANDLGWACVLMLESLVPVVIDPILGDSRPMVTPKVKERAKEMAETWKKSLEERGGIESVKCPDVHTFLQHLVTFGIFKKEDLDLYRKLVVGSAWRKQMPKLAVSLGLSDQMPDMIEELISRGQQVDAVHFTFEVGLEDKFPPVPLLKAFLKDAKKAADSILGDPNNSGRAAHLAARKEQSALRAVIKCIEEYKLAAEFPPENLRKRVEQLEKVKNEKKRPAAVPANKRTRANNGGPMPPAKAGRSTNAYVSSFPAAPAYVRSPSHTQYPTGVPSYPVGPVMYGNRSPPVNHYAYSPEAAPPVNHYAYSPEAAPPVNHYAYSPEAAPPANHYAYSPEVAPPPLAGSYPVAPMNYPHYGGYGNGVAPAYQQAYYR